MFRRQGDAVTQARKPFRPALEALEGRVVPAFAIRATEFDSLKNVVASSTQTSPSGPGSAFNAIFTLPDFSITIVGNNSNIGSTYAAHSTTINMLYTGPTGANSDSILIEVLGDSYVTPSAGPAQITSNASPSTSGLQASTVTMTSGVLNGDVALSGTPGTTLNGQLGQTMGAGSIGSASSVLSPNPTVSGSVFTLANPFTFYQTYTFGGFNTTGQAGSMSAGSEVDAVPNANNPHIAIVKLTNGTNNDDPPTPGVPDGPIVMVGSTVTWTYNVTNPGNEPIANVNVTDNIAGVNPLPVLSGSFNVGDTNDNGLLDPGETWVYTATGIATLGQYSNVGTVTGTSTITNTPVASDNPDHYFGVPVTPTITTQQTPLTGPVGTSTNDTAIVTGYYPTGTVTFNLYDNPNGTGTSLFTDTEPLVITPEEPLVGVATSTDFTITAPGTYYWVATYNGDNLNNNPVTSTTDGEPVVVATPAINIVKLTNGTNNDSPPVAGTPDGPIVPVGSTVTWTYNVTNPGTEPIANVAVSDNIAGVNPTPVLSGGFNVGDANDNGLLDPGETWEFTASGTATAGQYSNIGTVTGTSTITNTPVSATNPDHYYGYTTNINIVKLTNGTNNDNPPVAGVPDGPTVPVGSTVTWTYNVTTTGNVPLSSVAVSDNIAGVNPTPVLSGGFNVGDTNQDGLLEAGETWEFTASGTAIAGQYSNIGTATGTPSTPSGTPIPGAPPQTSTNPDHYYGTLSLGDFVWNDVNANGIQDSSDLTSNGINGVLVDLENSGGTVIATTTTGNNPVGGAPGYYQFSGLLQGTYTVVIDSSNFASGGALASYSATPSMVAGSTTANDSNGSPASVTLTTANDETIDFGYFKPGINIVKLTNGTNNDNPPVAGTPDGPTVPVGSTVTWTYNVTNPTGVALSSVSVSDNIAGVNPTPVLSGGFNVGDTNHDGLLEMGETWVFTATGTAIAGQYSNIGTATGTPVTPTGGTIPGATPVSATNPDHYYGTLSVGDFVWNDVNANGIQDSSDLTSNGINGVLVDLKNSSGTVIATTTTGNNPVGGAPGYYQFSGLLQGSYTVVIDSSNFASGGALAGYTATPSMVAGSTPANDSNGSPAAVTLTTANDETIDFGYFKPGINIVKLTNGTNNDSPPVAGTPDGPTVPVGSTVTWTYNVTNPTGVALSSVSVSDNIAGVNPTPVLSGGFNVGDTNHDGLLEMGETWVFTASGTAIAGQYSNIGTATGTPVTPTGGTIPGATPVSATNPDHYYGTLSVGDFVWNDVNANGIQDSSDLTGNGINGVLVDLENSGGTVIATTTTGNNPVGGAPGYYQFSGLLQGTYTVVIDSSNFNTGGALFGYTPTPSMAAGSTPANDSNGSPAPVTLTTANDETIDFGYIRPTPITITTTPGGPVAIGTPSLVVTKTANVTAALPFQPVTYTYTVTNTGNAPATNVSLVDDDGLPSMPAYSFTPAPVTTTYNGQTYNVGDANHDGLLSPGETWQFTATVIPPVTESQVINGTDVSVGTLIVQHPTSGPYAGDYEVTFLQSLGLVDNTYGTNASSGWGTHGHTFSDLTGSDGADFQFIDSRGNTVLQFEADYVSQGSSMTLPNGTTVNYPSGYGTLGLGGDGSLSVGNGSNILAINTTITQDLNQSSAYYGFTTNSPTPGSSLDANWNNVDGYTVVVSPATFGANGFGSVSIPYVHDSPSKLSSTIRFTPVAEPSTVTNTVTVTATAAGTTNQVTGSATTNVQIVPGGPTMQNTASIGLPTTFAPPATPLTDSATLSGGNSPTGTITFYLFAPGVTPNANNSNNVYSTTVAVSHGNGTYSTPATGYAPQTTGTYQWVAVYSGDGSNASVTSPFGSEPEAVSPPIFIATTPGGTVDLNSPSLVITKTANATAVLPFQPVTYTYTVSNNGSAAATNVSVVDDNGTPGSTGDDFSPAPVTTTYNGQTYNVGDANHDGLLSPGETWQFTATVIPPVTESQVINGTDVDVGTLSVQQLPSGDYKVTFLQSLGLVDNTYGTNASSGWGTQGHKFSDLTGSDGADFQFTDGRGNTVLQFEADYVSQSSSFPSDYGTLGLGGDGSLSVGNSAWIRSIDTTITDDLNQSPAYYGFTTNSPTPGTTLDASWNNVDGYTVVISSAAFGANGFGSVSIPYVHDSPSKLSGTIRFTPVAEPSTVTNNVTVTATGVGSTTQVTANTGVSVQIVPGGPANPTPVTASSSSAAMPTQLTDSATITGGNNPTGTVTFYLFAPGVTPNATFSNNVFTTAVTVNGAGTYPTPSGYTPMQTGTYQWVAVYSGDSNNPGVTSPFGSEPETVGPPVAISTTPGGTVALVNGVASGALTDSATISGGYRPGGSVTFYLYAPGVTPDALNDNYVYTVTVPVTGDGTYTTPGGFTPTMALSGLGTYEWVAVYSGDLNNAGVSSPFSDEPEIVNGGTPNVVVTKTADRSSIAAGMTAGYTVTITSTGTGTATGVTLSDPLPAGSGGDVNWMIDGTVGSPADFTITGSPGHQSLTLSSYFLTTLGDSLAPGASISVHITSPTNTGDANGGALASSFNTAGTAASGFVTLGTASNYSVLGLINTAITNSAVTITGNEGVSQGGSLSNMASSSITGNVYEYASGQYSGPGILGGSVITNASLLAQNDTDALNASTAAAGLSATQTFGNITAATTVNGNGGLNVIDINGNINLNNASLTLSGSASDVFIVNVTGNATFGGTGGLMLGSGVTVNHVLYNFTGTVGGPAGTITSHVGNVFYGTLLAPHESFNLDGSFVGEIIGGGSAGIQLLSNATVNANVMSLPNGLSNTATVTASGVASQQASATITIAQPGTISGTKFLDTTGKGFGGTNSPLGGVPINLYNDTNNNGVLDGGDSLVATTTTSTVAGQVGTYSFTGLAPGTYFVQEVVPSGYVQTGGGPNGSAGATYYTVTVQSGQAYAGNNFDDYQTPTCAPTNVSYYVVNNGSTTSYSNLSGNTNQGNSVTAVFTVTMTETLSLVSYIAPGPSFDATTAYQQQIFDVASGTFTPGTYMLTVLIPNSYYQIDFVCGQAISTLGPQNYGPDSGNIFYTPQGRLLSADNDGTTAFAPHAVAPGDFAKNNFWGTAIGQNVIKALNGGSTATYLAYWLATTFPNLYGPGAGSSHSLVNSNGTYFTNAQVATAYAHFAGNDQQVLSSALSVYATSINLAGTNVHSLDTHFNTSMTGSAMDTVSVGPNGAAFGLANNTTATVMQLLVDLNANTAAGAAVSAGAGPVFTGINNTGNVTNGAPTTAGGVSYTPAQVRAAYGVSNLALDGTGQTIAIVDGYDNPAIFTALDTFDAQFGVTTTGPSLYDQYGAAASFLTVVNQSGQTGALPATDPTGGWELEEELDVEWIHALAPGAQIVLVEANSQSLSDLMTSVQTAAGLPGVSVVSMSWGFAEGVSVLAQDEATYDADLTTPAGHQGVTFVASTGDYGTADPEYPAFSPNVVAVGGTSLLLNGDGSYNSETGWGYNSSSLGAFIGSGGGVSQYEAEPAYQQSVQSTGFRTTPDVSFVADPGTGAWVADPFNKSADDPWQTVGGTSLSAPSWAGLFALANQGRTDAGLATLGTTTPNQAQQALYTLPLGDFNDVTTGFNGYSAGPGYDLVTGLGTPVASQLVPDLAAFTTAGPSPRTVTVTAGVGSGSLGNYSSMNALHNVVNVEVAGATGLTLRDSQSPAAAASTSPALDLSVLPKSVAAAPVSALTFAPTQAVNPLAVTAANGFVTLPTAVSGANGTVVQVVSQAPVSLISAGLVQAPQSVASRSTDLFAELARGRAISDASLWQHDDLFVPAANAREPLANFGTEAPAEEQVLDSIFGSLAADDGDEALVLAPGIREVDAACAVGLAWLALSASAEDERNSRKSSGLPQRRSPKV